MPLPDPARGQLSKGHVHQRCQVKPKIAFARLAPPDTDLRAVPKVIRSSERHQVEKDLAARPEAERAVVGEAETNLNMQISEQEFRSRYDQVQAGTELADLFRIEPTDLVLRRRYDSTDRTTGLLLSSSVSYMPVALVSSNPALLDEANEPWPGGTQHQLSTVGVEIMTMVDEVTARMPTTAEAQLWGLPDGVPLIFCRRISLDFDERIVEISDAEYPADRTELRFVTPLKPWPKRASSGSRRLGRQGGRPDVSTRHAR